MTDIRERRVREGQQLVFDARDVLNTKLHEGEVLLKMVNGPISFTSPGGVRFWKRHPFQWVTGDDVDFLRYSTEPQFVEATVEDVEDYYAY
jgi:hypothetical protein